jgi:hypothetical protein
MMTDMEFFIMLSFCALSKEHIVKRSDEGQNSIAYLHVILSLASISNPIKSQHKKQQNLKFSCAFSLLRSS